MRRALELARQGRFTAAPNPRVGCVIVREDCDPPRAIGEGYHRRRGEPHAERMALRACSEDPRGATLYVNLEPCCHYGATPPCTDAIVQAGIGRVVAAMLDPFPKVAGKGADILRNRGVRVDYGLLEEEAFYLNRFFVHRHKTGLPWVILKTAISIDGKMATRTGDSKWITNEDSRRFVHELRAECGAVLAGVRTVLADDPLLTVRLGPGVDFNPPIRAVLDPHGETPLDSNLLKTAREVPLHLFIGESVPAKTAAALEKRGARVHVPQTRDGLFPLRTVLETLTNEGAQGLLVEGGSATHTAFLEENLVNELFAFIAPILVGGNGATVFYAGRGADTISEAVRLENPERRPFGNDTLIRGILRRQLV